MKAIAWLCPLVGIALLFAGCNDASHGKPKAGQVGQAPASARASEEMNEEAEIKASLAKLSPEDRKIAEEQRFCAVQNESRLGSMGAPIKVMLKDEAVFLCCKGCSKKAQDKPDQTLAKAKELREENGKASRQ